MVRTIPHIEHKGYVARATWSVAYQMFSGHVTNTRARIHFTGKTIGETRRAMRESVENYLERCRDRGKEPEVPSATGKQGRK